MTAIPRHRGQLGHVIHQPIYTIMAPETPWWAGVPGARRIIVILVLVVLLAHGYPVPVA